MFWDKSSTSSTVERQPKNPSSTDEEAKEQGTEGRQQRTKEVEEKIAREVQFQRVNSQISGNEPLSCMKSFDKLLGCYSVSNQIKSIYRFGNLDYELCNHSFRDLKFCLNLKYNFDNSDPNNDQQSFQWNLRKAEKVFEAPNSQDVWEARAIVPLNPTLPK
ncbi:hypothetical protein PTTG_08095 [Puccinia triticina 1-1 BBBD Race 1]|uniref:Uncharacterized protein n=2 Tax=Puccinia triticina TaxID=208348 RepID=A0A0C4F4Q5_PUCT1|nr:uncharacterized protein PtA15_6A329 [Puccinia triticina]OAV96934.1 hypothetical protein PTTG_08095 [Puccinia triticina 1-1 BBBD Race 1]WAQ85701.1 hypothetical protein PtA15_6A329 [Puccinia triticina]WAR55575.1 hypothetical protein PtB15_6B316 [Puccinia triticina]